MSKQVVKRIDIIRQLHKEAGLPYLRAEQVCTVLMRLLENSVAAKATINLGRIGSLHPVEKASRRVVMGCKRSGGVGGGTLEKVKREFWLGPRTRYAFRLNRAFGHSHGLSA